MNDSTKKRYRCPSCKTRHDGSSAHHLTPFCSERCQLVDLGSWMQEAYCIPVSSEDFDEQQIHLAIQDQDSSNA